MKPPSALNITNSINRYPIKLDEITYMIPQVIILTTHSTKYNFLNPYFFRKNDQNILLLPLAAD